MIKALAYAALLASAVGVTAGEKAHADNAVVVELFTSQGCSSCPPADALLHQLSKVEDVIPLALHVDYWDYIGWKDSFASPRNTERQKAYAAVGARRMIYTPQMVIMGHDAVVGADVPQVSDLVNRYKRTPSRVQIEGTLADDGGSVTLRPVADVSGPFVVQLVRYSPYEEVSISRGELAGRTMKYSNIVRDWAVIGTWDGIETSTFDFALAGTEETVVIVQHAGPGPILGAIKLD